MEEGTEGESRPPLGGEGPPQRKHHRVSRKFASCTVLGTVPQTPVGRGVIKSARIPSLQRRFGGRYPVPRGLVQTPPALPTLNKDGIRRSPTGLAARGSSRKPGHKKLHRQMSRRGE
ncbi:hypothetical protein FCV25MIE_10171 [Fagus crenata]